MLLQVDVLDKAIHRSVATRDAAGSDAGSDALGSGVSIAVTRHSAVPTAELPRSASDASVIDHFRLLFESAEFNELGEEKATSEDLRVSRRAGKRRPKFVGLDTKKVDVSKVTSKVGAYIGTGTHAKKREVRVGRSSGFLLFPTMTPVNPPTPPRYDGPVCVSFPHTWLVLPHTWLVLPMHAWYSPGYLSSPPTSFTFTPTSSSTSTSTLAQ